MDDLEGYHDIGDLFDELRGEDFITAWRGLALLVSTRDDYVICSVCRMPAQRIVMQRCGEAGGPVCDNEDCLDWYRECCQSWHGIHNGQPFCRRCGNYTQNSHIYTVSLFDPTEPEVVVG